MSGFIARLQALVPAAATAAGERGGPGPPAEQQRGHEQEQARQPVEEVDPNQTRRRRATDATLSSVSTVSSESVTALGRHEMQRLVTCRMGDLGRLSRMHPVSKVLQQESWDCGLACVCMVVRAFGHPTCTVGRLASQVGTQSVWTIDLVFLLHSILGSADFTYYTTCIGINPEHAKKEFYSDALEGDEERVVRLFAMARQRVRVVELEIPLLDLQRFLAHRCYVAVLLVDGCVIRCMACRADPAAHRGVRTWLTQWHRRRRFVGHYILLIAYIPSLDVFIYRDPALTSEFCVAPSATIDAARCRPGTDADCIVVRL
ncbi:hypothetical protein H4R21_001214 [Coemansia helicoidea]|uniref:Uncharacterized protein n=1 Tax=Coemansia helicoidea TaxID=1286919 RepID=A0ACC1LDJ0_9FUNG|nr:hypothetical protein H4R21_001214 [Coemansia helicoidea]